jgi:hypothetical protein
VKLCNEDEGPSQYKNHIYIPTKFIGNKRAYIEEAMHFLRLSCSRQNDAMVQEFFAGIAVLSFDGDKNLVFWKESDVDRISALLEDERVSDVFKKEVEHALDTMAGYDMANAFYKQGLIDAFLNTYPRIIYDSDQSVVVKALDFFNKIL